MRGSSDSDKAVGVLLPFAAGYYLSYLFRSINALIAGDLVAELGLGAADLGLLTSAYFLVFAAVVLPCGVLQSMLLRPKHMDLGNKVARADLTKNGDPRIYHLTAELVAELRTLEPRVARERNGTPKTLEDGSPDLRVFGYSDRKGPLAPWKETCKSARMPYLSPREAGRHGFGTETIVRQKLDPATLRSSGIGRTLPCSSRRALTRRDWVKFQRPRSARSTPVVAQKLAYARGRRLKTMKEQKVA